NRTADHEDRHSHHGRDEHGEHRVEGGRHLLPPITPGRLSAPNGPTGYRKVPGPVTGSVHTGVMKGVGDGDPGSSGVLKRLRGPAPRPLVDPGLAGGLRDWLEDGLAEPLAALPAGVVVRMTKDAVNQVLTCEAHLEAQRSAPRRLSVPTVRGILVDTLFRQQVTAGEIGSDPIADAIESLGALGDRDDVAGYIASLDSERRDALAAEVEEHLSHIRADWPRLPASWLARTQERLLVPLGGGRVLLSGILDLALGSPSAGRASVCVVEVKSGRRRVEHRGDIHLYALMETLRSSAPPFRVATYYSATGEVDVEPVGEDALQSALHRVLAATSRVCRLAAGATPGRTPNAMCAWCAGLDDCAPGQARTATSTSAVLDEDDYDDEDEQVVAS
ncbi:MAG: PD-(D/E)XK nuclease family protein, partial [Acidimicrobiales bacterium]